jgi:Zn-dependent protease
MPDLTPAFFLYGFIWYVVFLFSTTCHEAAHAWVARRGGDETAAKGGQVSLNPIPHIQREPFGMVLVPLLSYVVTGSMIGWASAPFDPQWERNNPRRAGWMALAGPAANFTLMLLAVIGLRVGLSTGWVGPGPDTGVRSLAFITLIIFFSLNLLLGTFNLLPVPPLDGSTGIAVFMSEEQGRNYLGWLRGNSYASLGLLVALLFFRQFYQYIEHFAAHLLLPGRF